MPVGHVVAEGDVVNCRPVLDLPPEYEGNPEKALKFDGQQLTVAFDQNPIIFVSIGLTLAVVVLWFVFGLSLVADFIPLAVAIAGIVFSYWRPEGKGLTTIILILVGFGGTAIVYTARIRSEATETARSDALQGKLNTIGIQNTMILNNLTKTQTAPTGAAVQPSEAQRRESILAILRSEYIRTHQTISEYILAGGPPPADWVNDRLKQLGQKWTVTDRTQQPNTAELNLDLLSNKDVCTKLYAVLDQLNPKILKASDDYIAYSEALGRQELSYRARADQILNDFVAQPDNQTQFALANYLYALLQTRAGNNKGGPLFTEDIERSLRTLAQYVYVRRSDTIDKSCQGN